jgi:hypothetical protein
MVLKEKDGEAKVKTYRLLRANAGGILGLHLHLLGLRLVDFLGRHFD